MFVKSQLRLLINFWVLKAQQGFNYSFNRYDISSKLITDYCTFFLTDSRGFVWISSTNGLNRFDGQRTKVYKNQPEDSTSLADNNIQSPLFEDKNGNIWFCTYEAIHCYKRKEGNFERIWIDKNGQKIQSDYYAFHLDTEGYLWLRVGSRNRDPKLYKLNTTKNQFGKYDYTLVSEFNGYRTISVNQSETKGFRFLSFPAKSGSGFVDYVLNKSGKVTDTTNYFTGDEKYIPIKLKQILPENETKFWLAADVGLVYLDSKTNNYKVYDTYKSQKVKDVLSIVKWKKDTFIVSAKNMGILFFDKKSLSFYHQIIPDNNALEGNNLCSNGYEALHLDKVDNLWLFSWENSCINHINLRKVRFKTVSTSDSKLINGYTEILEDKNQRIWANSILGEIHIFNSDKRYIKTVKPADLKGKIRELAADAQNRIWLCTEYELAVYDEQNNKFKIVFRPEKNTISDIHTLKNGKLILSLKKSVHEIIYDGKNLMYPVINIKGLNQIGNFEGDMYQDDNNHIYLMTDTRKISTIDISKNEWEVTNNILFDDFISSFSKNKDTLWFSGYKGLWKVYPSAENNRQIEKVLDLNFIWQFNVDKNGTFWLVTDSEGLFSYNPFTHIQKKFTASDGINSKFLSRAIISSKGEVWLTGRKSLTIFNPNEIIDYDNPPKVQITGIKINERDYTEQGEISEITKIKLDYTQNNIEIEFSAIEFGNSPSNRVKFRLDNLDVTGKWIEKNNIEPSITYYKLPPGEYIFRVKGFNSDGFESKEDKILHIEITPPWYQTWWARISGILLLLTSIYIYVKWRLRLQHQRAAMQQKVLKTEMKALRAQMDPHFLYNTMNSINAFILQNDRIKASRFLTDFSVLIRKILDLSKEEMITIEQEEDILRGYLEMESLRFNNFDYDIIVDDDIDPYDTLIPTMILQPFLENAILHGIKNKTNGRGKILIKFEPDGKDFLKCILEDNGVGRLKSAEINKDNRSKSHVSKGMSITNDRIDILNYQRTLKTSLLIEDLITDDNQPAGTRVTIRMPYFDK